MSRRAFYSSYLIIIICLAAVYFAYINITKYPFMKTGAFIFGILAFALIIITEIRLYQTRLVIYPARLMISKGILEKHQTSINYSHIAEVSLKQSVWERILGIGSLTIFTSGQKQHELVVNNVPSPGKIKDRIKKQILSHQYTHRH